MEHKKRDGGMELETVRKKECWERNGENEEIGRDKVLER